MKNYLPVLSILFGLFFSGCKTQTSSQNFSYIDLSDFGDGIHHWELYSTVRSTQRLDTTDITGIADNLLAYQNADGGWPKNIDWLAVADPDSVVGSLTEHYRKSTFDNRNTWPQIAYLSAVFQQTGEEKYRAGAERGFRYILDTEYRGGGWRGWDADAITFNDDVMTGIMGLLLDVKTGDERYKWVGDPMRDSLFAAYERGLQVILKCQIEFDGKKTGWCQQHDFVTGAPVQGRSYEHPSVTARESCGVLLMLMRIPDPDSAIYRAIEAGVAWLEEAMIRGYRYEKISITPRPYHETTVDFDRVLVPDSTARPVWARYYDLQTGKPFLSQRDGTIVYKLSDVSFERRVGYAWYGYWPEEVFAVYGEWSKMAQAL